MITVKSFSNFFIFYYCVGVMNITMAIIVEMLNEFTVLDSFCIA